MASKRDVLQEISDQLEEATRLLDRCAHMVKDSRLDDRNVRRIAEAMGYISQVAFEIYAERPDLMPEYLRDELRRQGREGESLP